MHELDDTKKNREAVYLKLKAYWDDVNPKMAKNFEKKYKEIYL